MARNLTRGSIGRQWMAIRDMDIAAEIIGVNPLKAKLSAFAVSSFYVGISGALSLHRLSRRGRGGRGLRHPEIVPRALHDHHRRARGRSSEASPARPSWCCLPVALKVLLVDTFGWDTAIATHFQFVVVGFLIMFFLIVEPHGLARSGRF
jgi:branched-chain amino acid transport system permease protein